MGPRLPTRAPGGVTLMRFQMIRIFALAAATAVAAAPAFAKGPVTDSDGDGSYSWAELTAAWPDLAKTAFAEADADGDGLLSEAELKAAQAAGTIPA